ncbi:MAG: YncE family protein [Deltaproteobacteria bacterium]|nr:YncE family protein [Deltaproteobacteria bacterium]
MKRALLYALLITFVAVTVKADAGAVREMLLVGNSVSGTVSLIDASSLRNLGSINVIPDLKERLREIHANPWRCFMYGIIKFGQKVKKFEPAGGDRFVDDVFASPDGSRLYVSRANLGDVAAFDLTTPGFPMVWRTVVAGYKADHAAMSPDGSRIVVSATFSGKAQVLETAHGQIVGSFKTGYFPHQNDFSHDGRHIYNSSLGAIFLPAELDWLKGRRLLEVVDAKTLKILKKYSFKKGVRPNVISEDETTFYTQLSYYNGVVKYDLRTGKVVASAKQPLSEFAKAVYSHKNDYPHNSAHHGLALSGDGAQLCDAGTIDNTVSIVSTSDMKVQATIEVGNIPYWATTSHDGRYCYVSLSGDGTVSVIDYNTRAEVTRVSVDRFPQRSRLARLAENTISLLGLSRYQTAWVTPRAVNDEL